MEVHLSYTASIDLDDSEFEIQENLFVALKHVRTDTPSTFWVGTICINQEDNMEKGWQVAQMGQIYEKAVETIVWLGPAADNSNLAMNKFAAIGEESLRCGILELSHSEFEKKKWISISVGKRQCDDAGPLEQLFRTSSFGSTMSATFPVYATQPLLKRQWGRRI